MLVVCNGMNRAGSTLQYNIVRTLIERLGVGQAGGYLAHENVDEDAAELRAWCEREDYYVIKVHGLPSLVRELSGHGGMYVCYIYRDLRNVAASFKRMWDYENGDFEEVLGDIVRIDEAVRGLEGAILIQRYEAVMADIIAAVRDAAAHLGLEPSEADVLAVAQACSKESMAQQMEAFERRLKLAERLKLPNRVLRRLGFKTDLEDILIPRTRSGKRRMDQTTLLHPNHVSQYASDEEAWRKILDEDEVALIHEHFAGWLERQGYV